MIKNNLRLGLLSQAAGQLIGPVMVKVAITRAGEIGQHPIAPRSFARIWIRGVRSDV